MSTASGSSLLRIMTFRQPDGSGRQRGRVGGRGRPTLLPFNVATSCDVNANGNGSQTNMADEEKARAGREAEARAGREAEARPEAGTDAGVWEGQRKRQGQKQGERQGQKQGDIQGQGAVRQSERQRQTGHIETTIKLLMHS